MKGIIMAGGSGSRLRPLTCDLPKPMVPIMNRPVMSYSIDLFKKHGIVDIGVTLQYLPRAIQDHFGDRADSGVKLHYFIEDKPLGTAGSVKNAQDLLDETFIVISGDALTNIDLSKAIDFHRRNKSTATLILKKVGVPLEYGVVMTNEHGEIIRFLEKPGWGEVFSDTVNTGIYILEPQVLDYFNADEKFDFSKDLFPLLLKDKKPMYGYITDEYWCDIGDIGTYLQSHFDFMDGSVGMNIDTKQIADGIWVEDGVFIHPSAKIHAPCYIGRNSKINEGTRIHPFTVIGENNSIGEYANIGRSILWKHNIIDRNVEIKGSIICGNTRIGNNVRVFEGSAIGHDTCLHENVVINPDVKIWPCKRIEQGMVVNENIIWGTRLKKTFFGKDGIKGYSNTDINPRFTSRLGAAYGTGLGEGGKICISSDDKNACIMLKHSLIAGALSAGLKVIDIGHVITPVSRYAVRFMGLDGGIHIRCENNDPNMIHIHLIDKNGANLPSSLERKIENIFISGDFNLKSPKEISKISFLRDIPMFYVRQLINSLDVAAIKQNNFRILLDTQNQNLSTLFHMICTDTLCEIDKCYGDIRGAMSKGGYDLAVKFDDDGEEPQIFDEDGKPVDEGAMVALLSLLCFKQDKTLGVVVPYTAPLAIEKMAETYQSSIIRSKTKKRSIMEEVIRVGNSDRRGTMERFSLYFDGIFTVMGIIELMAKENKELSNIMKTIPDIYMSIKNIECPWTAKGRIMRTLIDEVGTENSEVELFEGIRFNDEKGWALILPDSDEPLVRVYSEGISEEYAEELCDFYIKKIEEIKGD